MAKISVGTPLSSYGEYAQTNDRILIARINEFTWHRFASVIEAKSGVSITGFGSALVHNEDVLVPLYLEGEEDRPCRILLQFPLVQVSLKYPYDSLLDRTWATVSTLRFLQNRSQVPIPHVYYFFLEGVDILGGNCPWIIIERLPGMSLSSWLSHLSTSHIQSIGQQWGQTLAIVQSFRFNSVGSLRTTARGKLITTETVGSDPDGNHLTADHYSSPSRTHNGVISRPRDVPRTSIDHLFSLANTSTIRLMKRLSVTTEDESYEAREQQLWSLAAYVSARHLHTLIPQYAESNVLENYLTFDLPNFEIGNIHIDGNGNICGIVDWSGVNIVPSHIAFRLPQTFQNLRDRPTPATSRNMEKLRALEQAVVTQFEQTIRKKGILTLSTIPGGLGMAAIWARGYQCKEFEKLLYRFTGDVNSVEFQTFLRFVHDSWAAFFPNGQKVTRNQDAWRKHVQKRWDTVSVLYPRQCTTPWVPKYPSLTPPDTPPPSDVDSSMPKKKHSRLQKSRTARPKQLEVSSFEMDDAPRIGLKLAAIRTIFGTRSGRL